MTKEIERLQRLRTELDEHVLYSVGGREIRRAVSAFQKSITFTVDTVYADLIKMPHFDKVRTKQISRNKYPATRQWETAAQFNCGTTYDSFERGCFSSLHLHRILCTSICEWSLIFQFEVDAISVVAPVDQALLVIDSGTLARPKSREHHLASYTGTSPILPLPP